MKQLKNYNSFLMLICLIFISNCLLAQNTDAQSKEDKSNSKEFNQKELVKASDENTVPLVADSTDYIINRINNIDTHIKAIDTKVEHVSNDKIKKAKAEKEGWFTDMQKIKNELKLEKTLLESKLSLLKLNKK